MKTVIVRAVWHSSHEIEVPDDFVDTGHLSDFPEDVLDEFSSHMAELVDWEVSE